MTMNVTEIIRKTMGPMFSMKTTAIGSGIEYACASQTQGKGIPAGKGFVYEESAPYSYSIKLIISLGFFVLSFLYSSSMFGHYFGLQKAPEQAQFALLLAVSLYALIMWGFFSMKFRITDSGVEAVMPPIKYSIPFSEIKEVRTIENTPWYVGWGVRLWGRGLSFVSVHKRAVAIEKRKGIFRTLILTTQDPEEFIKKLKEEMG